MSYARFGFDGSQVYVYHSTSDMLVCCGCALDGSFETASRAAMIDHLRDHEAAGYRVPLCVFEAFEAEIASLGDDVRRGRV